ncbi:hypothetical protein M6B38_206215 [Iris pallida]|uniref:Uncharacterized protein n=1 Tax=Iris pallida TaxID=29817 RepID=A0AAX6E6Q3_IRIPA|nr:hypothetical protein M6B38_206215 [Iris pallida]
MFPLISSNPSLHKIPHSSPPILLLPQHKQPYLKILLTLSLIPSRTLYFFSTRRKPNRSSPSSSPSSLQLTHTLK